MSKDMEQDIILIREWLSKEEYLPQDFGKFHNIHYYFQPNVFDFEIFLA